jgi:hypothetical protein
MKTLSFFIVMLLLFSSPLFAQVGINSDGSLPDPSAGLDVNFPDKGLLISRVTFEQRNAIQNPAEGLLVFCTNCTFNGTGTLSIYLGGQWLDINAFCTWPPNPVEGTHLPDVTQITWNWINVPIALGYKWSTINDYYSATDVGNTTSYTEAELTCWTTYTRYVWAYNACGVDTWNPLIITQSTLPIPFALAPTEGIHVSTYTTIEWNWNTVTGASGYKWNTENNIATATDMGADLSFTETGLSCATSYTRYVWAYDVCGYSTPTALIQATQDIIITIPTEGTHVATLSTVVWNWNAAPGATGYRWNIINDYTSASDVGNNTTKTETGLTCSNSYIRYIWAYFDECGYSAPVSLTQTTESCSTCIDPITINHVAGSVAPVTKTVTYGTVMNIPGEPSKCWITSNLGADHQATAKDDATEASAGWYWQFNRMQGYKHTGSAITPSWTITSIDENSDWLIANDPCHLELGSTWRIPSYTEWFNVDAGGGWVNWNGPWNSALKMHTAGYVLNNNGALNSRGSYGIYWSSSQLDNPSGWYWFIDIGGCYPGSVEKAFGFPIRCLRE